MTRTYRYITSILSTITLLSVASCSSPEVEIVESNYEFSPSKDATSVDKPKPYIFKSGNFVAPGEGVVRADFLVRGDAGNLKPTSTRTQELTINVLKGEVTKDLNITVRESQTKAAKVIREGKMKELPEGILSFDSKVTISKGAKSTTLHLTIPEVIAKDLEEGRYATVLELVPEGDDFGTAEGFNEIIVTLGVNTLDHLRDNVRLIDAVPAGAKLIPSEDLYASSRDNDERSDFVLDGDKSNNLSNAWLSGQNAGNYLDISLGEEARTVKYIDVFCPTYNYGNQLYSTGFTKCRVQVSTNGGETYYEMGSTGELQIGQNEVIISLQTPVNVTNVRLYDFQRIFVDGSFISEVSLYEPETK